MHFYVNIQYALNQMREEARMRNQVGPSVMVIGAQ